MTNTPERYVILAAVAFDETGQRALWEGARQAELHSSAELHVVHVASVGLEFDATDARLRQAADALRARIETIQLEQKLKVTAHIRHGLAARAIVQTAADLDADLIIVGTHKRAGVEKLVLGSVAERVLRDAHCPVLVSMPKDHLAAAQNDTIDPVCPDCVTARRASTNPSFWCERHARSRLRPHVYNPSDSRRPRPMES